MSVVVSGARPAVRALTVLSAALLAACGDSSSTGINGGPGARLSFAVTTGVTGAPVEGTNGQTDGTARSQASANGLRVTSGTDELLITRVQLVVRELELERAGDDNAECDDRRSRDPECNNDDVEIGPFLIDLPLNEGVTPALALDVPSGTYDELEMVLHTPDNDDAEDRAFLVANPGFRRISAIVEGTFNGQPFTYVTRARAKYELEFEPPITIGPDGDRITVDVNVGAWFARRGGGLISPLEASMPGAARARVEQNIRHTFRVFRDRDRDGRRDDR